MQILALFPQYLPTEMTDSDKSWAVVFARTKAFSSFLVGLDLWIGHLCSENIETLLGPVLTIWSKFHEYVVNSRCSLLVLHPDAELVSDAPSNTPRGMTVSGKALFPPLSQTLRNLGADLFEHCMELEKIQTTVQRPEKVSGACSLETPLRQQMRATAVVPCLACLTCHSLSSMAIWLSCSLYLFKFSIQGVRQTTPNYIREKQNQ